MVLYFNSLSLTNIVNDTENNETKITENIPPIIPYFGIIIMFESTLVIKPIIADITKNLVFLEMRML
jgi:hypothetical protein